MRASGGHDKALPSPHLPFSYIISFMLIPTFHTTAAKSDNQLPNHLGRAVRALSIAAPHRRPFGVRVTCHRFAFRRPGAAQPPRATKEHEGRQSPRGRRNKARGHSPGNRVRPKNNMNPVRGGTASSMTADPAGAPPWLSVGLRGMLDQAAQFFVPPQPGLILSR